MPLLPPSVLRRNPLVGWEDISELKSAQAFPPDAVLLKPGTRARYAEVYNRVGLPLAVFLAVDPPWEGELDTRLDQLTAQADQAWAIAERLNAIVLFHWVRPKGPNEPASYYRLHPRGDSSRLAPFTPFVLLHKLGDYLRQEWADTNTFEKLNALEDDYNGDKSRGVDTAAGRMGVIANDYLSDLWAKWLLTGKVAYSATNPPPVNAREANFRNAVAEQAPKIFELWYEDLMKNKPMIISLDG